MSLDSGSCRRPWRRLSCRWTRCCAPASRTQSRTATPRTQRCLPTPYCRPAWGTGTRQWASCTPEVTETRKNQVIKFMMRRSVVGFTFNPTRRRNCRPSCHLKLLFSIYILSKYINKNLCWKTSRFLKNRFIKKCSS